MPVNKRKFPSSNRMPANLTPEQQKDWQQKAADRQACLNFRARGSQRAFDRVAGDPPIAAVPVTPST